jgi:hypothetical protein
MTLREKIATLFAESVGEDFSTFGEQDHLRAYSSRPATSSPFLR